ncbi:hypothetical protein [Jeotgalicoccus sp. WY2]|uniref:hypothetical protein n=1 Tax=Jeotgalicoccus sp. WY2 TaxID=2708346 RepID=UPI00201FB78B|nr:hypothetical protein [Jeotgalicoccus sp. WY2]
MPVGLDSNDYVKNELGKGLCSTEIVLKHYVEDALNKKEISVGLIRTLEKGIEYLKLEAGDFKDRCSFFMVKMTDWFLVRTQCNSTRRYLQMIRN